MITYLENSCITYFVEKKIRLKIIYCKNGLCVLLKENEIKNYILEKRPV